MKPSKWTIFVAIFLSTIHAVAYLSGNDTDPVTSIVILVLAIALNWIDDILDNKDT